MGGYLDGLNSAQRSATTHGVGVEGVGGPLLVIAGAGSGKTNTLAHRVAHILVSGVDPRRILMLTFSRRAAGEMSQRVERISREVLGERARNLVEGLEWSGTFHGIGARLLREHADSLGLDPGFTIHDREDSADLMNLVRDELGFSKTTRRFPTKGTCLAIYSRCVNAESPLEDVLAASFPWCIAWRDELRTMFASYVDAKQAENVLDYDDLLLHWAQAVTEPTIAAEMGGRFDHVLVDEYQDTNRLQASILLALKPEGGGLAVVGDDAQSIYAFRAAEVRNILDFPTRFDPPAKVVTLEQNYRSTQAILAAANGVIGFAKERFTKNLWTDRAAGSKPLIVAVRDEADQARYIVESVLANREKDIVLKRQAVLFRTSHHSGPLEVELTARNIPFVKFGGLKFLDTAHVKDVLATLRFAANPRDRVAGFRVLKLVPGIGAKTARAILDIVKTASDPHDALMGFEPSARQEAWGAFTAMLTGVSRNGAPGRRTSTRSEPGINRTSSGCTRTPRCEPPTSCNCSRSHRATRRANAL